MSKYPKEAHFIDTCILLEILLSKKSEEVENCSRYLKRIGNLFDGYISIPVLGEFSKIALEDSNDPSRLFEFMREFVEDRNVRITSISYKSLETAQIIMKTDSRAELIDSLHLACAKEAECNKFVTIDQKLVNNRNLEKLLKLKISHPKEFF